MSLKLIKSSCLKRSQCGLLAFMLVIAALFTSNDLQAQHNSSQGSSTEFFNEIGERLVTQFWTDVENQDVAAYSKLIACSFQGLNIEGVYNRDDQIEGLENLTLTAFYLENVVAAWHNGTLVVSYNFFAEGDGVVSGPSIDVWQKTACGWKLISHSYVPFLIG